MKEGQELKRPYFPEIENLFSEYVEFYGGKVVEKLEANLTDRQNADYLFENPDIVAELKTFEKDVFSLPEDFPRLEELLHKWLESGKITREEFKAYALKGASLPQKCIADLIERASKTIERAIYKADHQIEETKKTFNKENSNGIVFLINNGNYFFTNQGFLAIISNLIERKFKDSSFNVIIYLTINQSTRKEGSELDYNFWVPIYTKIDEKGETIVSDELHKFVNDFGERFLNEFLTLKTGYESKEYKQIETLEDSIAELKAHKFIPKDIIFKK